MLFIPHDMFFTSRPTSAIRVASGEICLTFIKLPQARKRQLLEAPQWANTGEDGPGSLTRGRPSPPPTILWRALLLRRRWTWGRVPEPVAGELNSDLDLALFSLTTYSTSLCLSFLVRKMAWVLRLK